MWATPTIGCRRGLAAPPDVAAELAHDQVALRGDRLVGEALGEAGVRKHHFTVADGAVGAGRDSQAELGRRLWLDRSDLHAVLNDLERDGARRTRPRRSATGAATSSSSRPQGTEELVRWDARVEAAQDELLAPLSAAERRELAALLGRVVAHHRRLSGPLFVPLWFEAHRARATLAGAGSAHWRLMIGVAVAAWPRARVGAGAAGADRPGPARPDRQGSPVPTVQVPIPVPTVKVVPCRPCRSRPTVQVPEGTRADRSGPEGAGADRRGAKVTGGGGAGRDGPARRRLGRHRRRVLVVRRLLIRRRRFDPAAALAPAVARLVERRRVAKLAGGGPSSGGSRRASAVGSQCAELVRGAGGNFRGAGRRPSAARARARRARRARAPHAAAPRLSAARRKWKRQAAQLRAARDGGERLVAASTTSPPAQRRVLTLRAGSALPAAVARRCRPAARHQRPPRRPAGAHRARPPPRAGQARRCGARAETLVAANIAAVGGEHRPASRRAAREPRPRGTRQLARDGWRERRDHGSGTRPPSRGGVRGRPRRTASAASISRSRSCCSCSRLRQPCSHARCAGTSRRWPSMSRRASRRVWDSVAPLEHGRPGLERAAPGERPSQRVVDRRAPEPHHGHEQWTPPPTRRSSRCCMQSADSSESHAA